MKSSDLFSLKGKTALVTGCRRGIGKAMTVALAEAGADIIGVSAQLEPDGGAVGKAVRAAGRTFHAYTCDFKDRSSVYAFMERVRAEAPPVDILVNNAGTILRKPAAEHPDEYWDEILEINLTAPFILAREFGKAMLERGYGKIIFTASLLTFQGGITVPSYAASKGGIGQIVKAFSNEWAGKGVHVNAIAPGYIATDVTDALQKDPVRAPAILARIPAGRWGRPEDFGGPVVFLASAASDYVDGTVLTVDGGWMGR
ncbi:MAG: SDR family oxidoreductase [Kiritimatiellia bacterium]|nr:SDR family oxidoreductase [Kiritimatiellia bacterium]